MSILKRLLAIPSGISDFFSIFTLPGPCNEPDTPLFVSAEPAVKK
jgi:hypothetical protein